MGSRPLIDAVVIGAGMTGLIAARTLAERGLSVTVVDKGRSVGGRMATRRFAGGRFDHGAQHFSARSGAFQAAVAGWRQDGVVAVWYEGKSVTQPERGVEPRHIGTGAMRTVPEHIARGLNVHTECRVDGIAVDGRSAVVVAGDRRWAGRSVIVTAPLPQSLSLLRASNIPLASSDHAALDAVEYDATLAVLATLEATPGLPDGHLAIADGPIAWIADNEHKGVSRIPAVTIHSSAAFAAAHLDADSAAWTSQLAIAAQHRLGVAVVEARGHRWRYAQPRTTLDMGAVAADTAVPVILAGEVFAGAKVEGAFLAGRTAASLVLARLS